MSQIKIKKSRLELLHQYYKYTGFYSFLGQSLKAAFWPFVMVLGILAYVHFQVININDALIFVTKNFSDIGVFLVFFASESILGLIPPDIFIAWTKVTSFPILYLSLLAFLSYLGGVVSYISGKALMLNPQLRVYFLEKMKKQTQMLRKWGGLIIAVGALLPLPFAIASLAAGMIKYDFKAFLIFALLRFLRFAIYGFAIYQMI